MTERTYKVEQFLKGERQWTRALRIANAQYQLRIAKKDMQDFWVEILRANGFYDLA